MDFSVNKNLTFQQATDLLFEKLGDGKVMALASSLHDHVSIRNVSCLFYDHRVFFKTDKNFRKTQQLLENPQVAMCWSGIQIEGIAENHGLVAEEPGHRFQTRFEACYPSGYNKYPHKDTEILIEIKPTFVGIWDTSVDHMASQIYLDFDRKTVTVKQYDLPKP